MIFKNKLFLAMIVSALFELKTVQAGQAGIGGTEPENKTSSKLYGHAEKFLRAIRENNQSEESKLRTQGAVDCSVRVKGHSDDGQKMCKSSWLVLGVAVTPQECREFAIRSLRNAYFSSFGFGDPKAAGSIKCGDHWISQDNIQVIDWTLNDGIVYPSSGSFESIW